MTEKPAGALMCPSSQPHPGARIFGMKRSTPDGDRIGYFEAALPATPEILALPAPALPTESFRLAAPCAEHGCSHFDGAHCQLGQRIRSMLGPVVRSLPGCAIRPTCRWFREHGKPVCLRCPQVVTDIREVTEFQRELAGIEPIEPGRAARTERDPAHTAFGAGHVDDRGRDEFVPRQQET
jgi:hypothetical protein